MTLTESSTIANSDDDSVKVDEAARWLFVVLGILTWTYGVFGNVLVLCTLAGRPVIRSTHNIIIGNLAVADLYLVGYGLPHWVLDLVLGKHPTVNEIHCYINGYVAFVCSVAGIFFLWTISLNRYISICHHSTYKRLQITGRKTTWYCVAMWALAAVFCSIPFFGPGEYVYETKFRSCFLNRSDKDSYVHVAITVPVSIFLASIAFMNASIFRFWRRSKRNLKRWTTIKALANGGRRSFKKVDITASSTKHQETVNKRRANSTASSTKHQEIVNKRRANSKYTSAKDDAVADETSDRGRRIGENTNIDNRQRPVEPEQELSQSSPSVSCMADTASVVASGPDTTRTQNENCCTMHTVSGQEQLSNETESTVAINSHSGGVFIVPIPSRCYCHGLKNATYTENDSAVKSLHQGMDRSSSESKNSSAAVGKKVECVEAESFGMSRSDRRDKTTPRVPTAKPVKSLSSNKSLVWSLLVVYLTLVVLYSVIVVVGLLEAITKRVPVGVALLANFLFFTNSSINWLIYAAFNKSFRTSYKQLLARCCKRFNRVHAAGGSRVGP